MRIKSNFVPEMVSVSTYPSIAGKADVRVRENIAEYEAIDQITGQSVSGYEYDEYRMIVPDAPGLAETVAENLDEWLLTGRTMEINQNATLYLNAKSDAVDEYTMMLIEEGYL